MRILLLGGTGLIGSRVLEILLQKNHDIWLLVRDQSKVAEYQKKSVHVLVGNAEENGRWIDTLPQDVDVIVNLIKPDFSSIRITSSLMESKFSPFMLQIAKNITYIASKHNVKRIYQSSSIYYYPSLNGQWVNEKEAYNKNSDNWGLLYNDLVPYLENYKQTPTTFLLYGALVYNSEGVFARNTLPYMYRNQLSVIGTGENWLQLTHVEDAAQALVHCLEINFDQPLINIVDDRPVAQKDFFEMLAYKAHAPHPISIPVFMAKLLYGDIIANSLSTSLRAKNDLLKSTGYWLKFPDYQAGLTRVTL